MTYAEFKAEMNKLLVLSFKYTVNEVGSLHYVEKMAALADAYPEYDEMLDEESLAEEA